MLLVAFLGMVHLYQGLQLNAIDQWETHARFWMTAEETQLFDRLDPHEREKFKGYFVARRLEHPEVWPSTGLQLPLFYIPQNHKDIRDALAYTLGQPEKVIPGPYQADQPLAWVYSDRRFDFLPEGDHQVRLANTSQSSWEDVKRSLILHPDLRYDFRHLTIGRNRLPAEIKWVPATLEGAWRIPGAQGTQWRVTLSIPESFSAQLREQGVRQNQTMEMLVFLKNQKDQARDDLEGHFVRHDSRRVDFAKARNLTFETSLPPGRFHAEILVYSGFLSTGLRLETTITVLPDHLPRIGDPIVSESWHPAGIEKTETLEILAGNTFYRPTTKAETGPSRVLVASQFETTQLLLQTTGQHPKPLPQITRADGWAVFESPPLGNGDRLIALAQDPDSPTVAYSSQGNFHGVPDPHPPQFEQAGNKDYVALEQLKFQRPDQLTLLSVNGIPLLASQNGAFPWPALDWGRTADLRFDYQSGNEWRFAAFQLRRNQVFQEIRVQPKFIVAGIRDLNGRPTKTPFKVEVEGVAIPPEKTTNLSEVPKLWGIVVSDPLLKSPAWGQVLDTFQSWLRREISAKDLVYIVHIDTRPRLILSPTVDKPLVQATLNGLHSTVELENYFTVRYLFDGLTQLPQHTVMPHQVLLLTHQLTEEVSQMETLLPILRETGLQLYNLEFPFEFQSESEERLEKTEADPLLAMKSQYEDDQWRYGPLKNNIQETTPVTAGWKFVFRTRGQKRDEAEEAIRLEAFRRAFNQQLANLTAGMTFKKGSPETQQTMFLFMEQLSAWQNSLVHVRLPLPFVSAEMIKVDAGEGHTAAWTLVRWDPDL